MLNAEIFNERRNDRWPVLDRDFTRAVIAAMRRQGLNQTKLAEKLNVTKSTVSRWLSGNADPKPEHRELLSAVLGLEGRWEPIEDRDILRALTRGLMEELERRRLRLSADGFGMALAQAWELANAKPDPVRAIPQVLRTVADLLEAGMARADRD